MRQLRIQDMLNKAKDHGVDFLPHDFPIAHYDLPSLRTLAKEMSETYANEIGCVVFPASEDTENVLIIFAGNLERFFMLSVARFAKCKVIYFQDSQSFWYQGSSLLPSLLDIADFLKAQTAGLKPIFFGQSSGGYAAVAASTFLEGSVVVACSPQTFSDRSLKTSVNFSDALKVQYTPDDLIDLSKFLPGKTSGREINIFSASCELNNPYTSHFWVDYLHTTRMLGIENVSLYIAEASNHSIVFTRSGHFSVLLRDIIEAKTGEERRQHLAAGLNSLDDAKRQAEWI